MKMMNPFRKILTERGEQTLLFSVRLTAYGDLIIAPPSNGKSGNKYKWSGVIIPIVDASARLIYEIQKPLKIRYLSH